MSNSVDPDETGHYEPSHLDLCCLQKPIIIPCGSETWFVVVHRITRRHTDRQTRANTEDPDQTQKNIECSQDVLNLPFNQQF